MPLCFAYYCSGHGYGHATRVSAFACHLLKLPAEERPTIYIISSAPKHVFADSIAQGAMYRYADIDPVIVQPLAYRVDRQKSVDVLRLFLSKKDILLNTERQWLIDIRAHAVLSDAAFLGCLAAKAAGLPSVLITNFTFDSVYSYLSSSVLDVLSPNQLNIPGPYSANGSPSDVPVPPSDLTPLVEQLYAGYRCADMLLLLPGHIPIPSFSIYPALPSYDWIDPSLNEFHPHITDILREAPSSHNLHPITPFASSRGNHIARTVVSAPLIVRPTNLLVYTPEGRSRFLSSLGVPSDLHDPDHTKILVVSFGGQVFRTPSRPASRLQSRIGSRNSSPGLTANNNRDGSPNFVNGLGISSLIPDLRLPPRISFPDTSDPKPSSQSITPQADDELHVAISPRLATPSHIFIPGAPPASKPLTSSCSDFFTPTFSAIPPTPDGANFNSDIDDGVDDARLLPDTSWIAIVCGVTKEQWLALDEDEDSGLPDGFFVAPKDVYMPDLTAIGDVLLGKLGYGTVSECVDSCTPFVYVSRPLFIEEHGLRLLLSREGVGVELSRQSYEAGDWATAVEEAWMKGKFTKAKRRADAAIGIGSEVREKEGREMAGTVVRWASDYLGGIHVMDR